MQLSLLNFVVGTRKDLLNLSYYQIPNLDFYLSEDEVVKLHQTSILDASVLQQYLCAWRKSHGEIFNGVVSNMRKYERNEVDFLYLA